MSTRDLILPLPINEIELLEYGLKHSPLTDEHKAWLVKWIEYRKEVLTYGNELAEPPDMFEVKG